jgi:hypothetical protein
MPSGADVVILPGPGMVGLIRAVGALGEAGIGRYAIVGGVAVTVRLGNAHRATADVDTVVDETTPPDAVEALLARSDARQDPTEPHRVFVDGTKVEILHVSPLDDNELDGIPTNDALFVAAHAWALDTATAVTVIAGHDEVIRVTAPFATPSALIAMKLHAVETRSASGQDKRAGDAWDLYRILVDLDADGTVRNALATAPPNLKQLIRDATDRILVAGANRTRGWLRSGDDQMATVTADDLRFVAQPVLDALA